MLLGRFRKLLNVLFNGRNTVVYFGEPMRLREAMADLPPQRAVRRVLRALRAEFRAQRASTIGPDLSHRRTMVAHILRTQAVRHAVRARDERAARAGERAARAGARARSSSGRGRRAVLLTARKYAMEIAANYSQTFVTIMASVLAVAVDAPVRRRGVRARREAARGRRRRRDHLRAVPSQPHGLSAALLRDLPQGVRRAARRRRRESQYAGGRTFPAQGRRVLPAPQLQGRRALQRRVQQVSRLHDGARPSARVLHRGRAQPHRTPARAAHRHAVDDRAQLSARAQPAGRVHAGVFRLRAHRRRAAPTSASCRARRRRRKACSA